jgi:hypothetical protein
LACAARRPHDSVSKSGCTKCQRNLTNAHLK